MEVVVLVDVVVVGFNVTSVSTITDEPSPDLSTATGARPESEHAATPSNTTLNMT